MAEGLADALEVAAQRRQVGQARPGPALAGGVARERGQAPRQLAVGGVSLDLLLARLEARAAGGPAVGAPAPGLRARGQVERALGRLPALLVAPGQRPGTRGSSRPPAARPCRGVPGTRRAPR